MDFFTKVATDVVCWLMVVGVPLAIVLGRLDGVRRELAELRQRVASLERLLRGEDGGDAGCG